MLSNSSSKKLQWVSCISHLEAMYCVRGQKVSKFQPVVLITDKSEECLGYEHGVIPTVPSPAVVSKFFLLCELYTRNKKEMSKPERQEVLEYCRGR